MYSRLLLTWTALSLVLSGLAETRSVREKLPPVQANVKMVLVPVTVMDYKGAALTGLQREHFTILQDNVPQSIVSFSKQDVPCSVSVIVDTSGSMYRQFDAAKSAVRAFLETVAASDETLPMSLASRAAVPSVWNSLQSTKAAGSTSFLDTLYLALTRLRSAHNPRRALLVVSDGADSHSRYSKAELMRVAIEADAQIYAVSIAILSKYEKPVQVIVEPEGSVLLDTLAERTGGLHFTVEQRDQASRAAAKIGQALRNQYVLGYRRHDIEGPGKWHQIRVKLDVPTTTVYARSGYYSR
jgi:Ca-activated chloride channel family protein